MILKTLTIQAPVGLNYCYDPKLVGANVISVKRNGSQQYIISEMPVGLLPNVMHDSSTGRIYVSEDYPFNFSSLDPSGARIIEYIFVIYSGGDGILYQGPPISP